MRSTSMAFDEASVAGAVTDSALLLAFDRDSVRDKDHDGRMKVAVTNISKATVNPYKGKEIPGYQELGLYPEKIYQMLRDPEELEKAAPTFNGIQLLRKHTPVSAEDHQPWDVVGATGTDAKFEHPYLKNSLHVWSQEAIDDIESGDKRELSCGYHYTPDMTPGTYEGLHFDGRMLAIIGNHVALVKDGRAGPDVVVGDSTETLNMTTKPTRLAALTLGLVAASVAPLIAKDSKIELPKALFADLTSKNINAKKAGLLAGVKAAATGKLRSGLAMDASMEHVGKVLDTVSGLFETEKGADESTSEEQHKAMEAAANGESNTGIPKAVGEEFAEADKGKTFDAEPLKAFLKEKGVSDEDIMAAMDLMPKAMAGDESEEEKAKREKAESEKKAEDEKKALDAKTAKDNEMKDMVTKPAMDAALKAVAETTAKSVRETERGIRVALAEVRPFVGELPATLAFDSGADVKRHALTMLGVENAKTLHADALDAVLGVQPKIGARPNDNGSPRLAMDADASKDFSSRFPDAGRIQAA